MNLARQAIGTAVSAWPPTPAATFPFEASASHTDLVSHCRSALLEEGFCRLPGFLSFANIQEFQAESLPLIGRGHRSDQLRNIYSTADDNSQSPDHPVRQFFKHSNRLVSGSLLPADGIVRRLYESDQFRLFLEKCRALGPLYRSEDSCAGSPLNVMDADACLPWHYDLVGFSASILIQSSTEGGQLEYVPTPPMSDARHVTVVQSILRGEHGGTTNVQAAEGDLCMFLGRRVLHRVTPVRGPKARVSVLFGFEPREHQRLDAEQRRTMFGQ